MSRKAWIETGAPQIRPFDVDLLDTLKADHQRLLAQTEEIERILPGLTDPLNSTVRDRLLDPLQQLITLLKSHDEMERRELFPVLRAHLPEANEWQVGMMEIEDEMILREAQHLHELASDVSSSVPVARLKESGARVVRWMRVHVRIEEERLFPRLQDLP